MVAIPVFSWVGIAACDANLGRGEGDGNLEVDEVEVEEVEVEEVEVEVGSEVEAVERAEEVETEEVETEEVEAEEVEGAGEVDTSVVDSKGAVGCSDIVIVGNGDGGEEIEKVGSGEEGESKIMGSDEGEDVGCVTLMEGMVPSSLPFSILSRCKDPLGSC